MMSVDREDIGFNFSTMVSKFAISQSKAFSDVLMTP